MKVQMTLSKGIDDDLLALYSSLGEKEFAKVLKQVFTAYETRTPFLKSFYNITNNTEYNEVKLRITLKDDTFVQLLSYYNSCATVKKNRLLLNIARMYLTPCLTTFYTEDNEVPIIPVKKEEKELGKTKARKPRTSTSKKVEEVKEVNSENNQTQAFDMNALMNNPEFQKMLATMTGNNIQPVQQEVKTPEPVKEENPEEVQEATFDPGLASLFGSIG